MVTSKQLCFGIKTAPQNTTYEDILRVWQEAEAIPMIEHMWLFDHLMPLSPDPTGPILEGWTLLAALAALTERLRIGLMVTNNVNRQPAVLAKIAATVDVISHGRLDFGLGAGGNGLENTAYGTDAFPTGERIRRLGEACEIIRRLWTETAPDFDGRYYHLKETHFEPKPVQKPYPPFVIGGLGEQLTLRIVARYADIWNFPGGTPEEFRRKNQILDGYCSEIGRDPADIERSVQVMLNRQDLTATREVLLGFIREGATHLILNVLPPYPEGIVRWLTTEVIEPVSEEIGK